MMKKILLVGVLGLASVSLVACGSHTKTNTTVNSTTTGQQLIDLEKAYSDGIITEDEYNKKKKEILKH